MAGPDKENRPQQRRTKQGPEGKGQGPGRPPSLGIFGMVAMAVLALFVVMLFTQPRGENIDLAKFKQLWDAGQIAKDSVVIRDDAILAKQAPGPDSQTSTSVRIQLNSATSKSTVDEVKEITGGQFTSQPTSALMQLLIVTAPIVIVIGFIYFLISRSLRGAGGGAGVLGNFGKSRHRTLNKEMTGITFADVAGIDEAKEEVTEIIEFLKNPKKFTKLGGRIPRGVLLVGEPGCGKTLLAKAIAGEADVPFFSISGSDFVEMFVGVGASRVRDLFKQAKDSAPCIIFLDEIDAVGRRRGSGFNQGGHDEREQTLNAILVEMDGFTPSDGVIVVAATNRADVLDPALVRPGRFDRQVVVPLPDLKGRLEILRVHAKRVKMDPSVDLEKIARGTPMFSGADLAAIINEAAISATMQNKEAVEHDDLEEARDKIKFGRSKKSRVREKEENRLVAYHEAGHAVLQMLLKDADPLHKVTIIPRGNYGGATFSLPQKDRTGYSLKWLIASMRVVCGGRIAEERISSDITSGASQDITQATTMARAMILEWGMSPKLGFVRYAPSDTKDVYLRERDFSEETARLIDDEIRRLVDEAFIDAKRLIDENWDKVVAVAEALIRYETLNAEDVERLMRGETITKPTVSEQIRAEERRKAAAAVLEQLEKNPADKPDMPPGGLPTPA
ncbi:MAG: ATP-dependent zinc metalloprotease FtsH [Tepidisphaera sp.]|nr:ATP-dependent zinc metalloprotease FtsH [Tepidisphaera sp.]